MEVLFAGKIIIILFIIFMIRMAIVGPFIYNTGKTHYIDLLNFKFEKTDLKIKLGDTIIFTNMDQIRWNVINDNDLIPNSDLLYQYDRYTYTFNIDFDTVTFNTSLYENVVPLVVTQQKEFKRKSYFRQILDIIF